MTELHSEESERAVRPAIRAGLRCRCPACGTGALFSRYLKVVDRCATCGTDLHHQRADDGPAYVTILIVAHLVGFAMPALFEAGLSSMTVAIGLSLFACAASLLLLQPMKGMFVAIQWARRMHGFA